MGQEEWTARWREKKSCGFQDETNPYLIRYAPRFPDRGRVLVPLCGRSRDMTWLSKQGFEVVGVEFVEQACAAFFEEQSIPYQRNGREFTGGGVRVINADWFGIDRSELGTFDWIFDRAALVAIPDHARYVEHEMQFLEPGKSMLLVALYYDPAKTDPPPHPVTPPDIERLFRDHELEKLEEREVLAENPRFIERGLDWLREHVWRVTRRS